MLFTSPGWATDTILIVCGLFSGSSPLERVCWIRPILVFVSYIIRCTSRKQDTMRWFLYTEFSSFSPIFEVLTNVAHASTYPQTLDTVCTLRL